MTKSIAKTLVVLLAFSKSLGIQAQDPNFHIYLCFGQSNMGGAAPIEAQDRVTDSRIQIMGALNCSQNGKTYAVGKWQNYSPPIVRCNANLGPSDYFARTMVSKLPSNVKVGIVPVAIEGSDIAIFEKANYASYLSTAESWMVNVANFYGGNPYARLVEVAKIAQKDGVIKGILVHQGETNNGQSTWPSRVKGIYDNLMKDLNLDPAKTPILVGELLYQNQGGACYFHNTVIAKVPSVIPNGHVISASGLAGIDQFHFNSASYRTLGQRYAEKMWSLYPKEVIPQTPFKGSPFQVPGRIEAEEYDLGGEGVAYHESDANGNQGSAILRNDQVDIETTSDGSGAYNIAYIMDGEWLEYTVNVASTGAYDLGLRLASNGAGRALHLEVGGTNVSGSIKVPNTGGWQAWQTVMVPNVPLSQGQHVLRVVFDANYMNFNFMEFKASVATGLAPNESAKASLFPNPFVTELQIRQEGSFSYKISNLNGIVEEEGVGYDFASVGAQLQAGMYYLVLRNEQGNSIRKILKR